MSHSRQPLVKGERLVRYEVNTVMLRVCPWLVLGDCEKRPCTAKAAWRAQGLESGNLALSSGAGIPLVCCWASTERAKKEDCEAGEGFQIRQKSSLRRSSPLSKPPPKEDACILPQIQSMRRCLRKPNQPMCTDLCEKQARAKMVTLLAHLAQQTWESLASQCAR